MLNSTDRKLSLSGWLQKNRSTAYDSSLRLQKFLFLYEVFSKVDNDAAEFSHLKGYKRGPVFSPVWGDYTKNRSEFDRQALAMYEKKQSQIDTLRAKRASFIVSSLSETELSALTHQYHIWNTKQSQIMAGERQVELVESDFDAADYDITRTLAQMYPDEIIQNCRIISMDGKYFVFSQDDIKRLTEQHYDTLATLAEQEVLQNPVYVEIDEEGRLCID